MIVLGTRCCRFLERCSSFNNISWTWNCRSNKTVPYVNTSFISITTYLANLVFQIGISFSQMHKEREKIKIKRRLPERITLLAVSRYCK